MHLKPFLYVSLLLSCSTATQAEDPFATHVRPTEALSPAEQQGTFKLPSGFEIRLFASEPQIKKPLNMAFDARGRLWVTETVEYPHAAPSDRKARDSIKILEDTDHDGHADQITTFADELNIPIGIYPYDDGAIVFSIPNIWRLRDTDGDGRADKREKLFGPMGYERDTHGLNNAFRRGFDGWLYACHGFNNETTVSGSDGHTVRMQSGNTYRMRLDGTRIEQFTWGQVNPFGMALDPLFNIFTADCHSKPIYQLVRGGYYPSFGKPHDGLGFVPAMMQHQHGSTAICGLVYYTGETFPDEYQGNIFTGNVMTSRVNRNVLELHGSTFVAREQPDFVTTTDPWFRPVDIQLGPDGALYVADFYNRIIGHYEVPLDHPGRDRHRGRIWRIAYTGSDGRRTSRKPDLHAADVKQLLSCIDDSNLPYSLRAMHELVDRFGGRAVDDVQRALRYANSPRATAGLLWILKRLDKLTDGQLHDSVWYGDRTVRLHAIKIMSEMSTWAKLHHDLVRKALLDEDAFVRRAAADALAQHPLASGISPLLDALAATPHEDQLLRHQIRLALRNHLREAEGFAEIDGMTLRAEQQQQIASICLAVEHSEAAKFLVHYVDSAGPDVPDTDAYMRHAARYIASDEVGALVTLVRSKLESDLDVQLRMYTAINSGLARRELLDRGLLDEWGRTLAPSLLQSCRATRGQWVNFQVRDRARSVNPWVIEPRRSADGDTQSRFISSLPLGEQLTGQLRSGTFTAPRQLSFYLAGHVGTPDRPAGRLNIVRLREASTGQVLDEALPPRSDVAQKVQWNLATHAGKEVYLEIVDSDPRLAFAWLAIGRFDPPVVTVPEISPNARQRRQQTAAAIANQLRLDDLETELNKLLRPGEIENETLAAAAVALSGSDRHLECLARILDEPFVADQLRRDIVNLVRVESGRKTQQVLESTFQTVPSRVQLRLAQHMASHRDTVTTLIDFIESGKATAALLQIRNLAESLAALATETDKDRLERLVSSLTPFDQQTERLIRTRVLGFSRAQTSEQRGAQIFASQCAACHQLQGQGALVGPQLDGIGNRGLERLVEDVLDSNRNVDVAFRSTQLRLVDGRIVTGLGRREEGETLVLIDNKGKEFSVLKSDIEEQRRLTLSVMPENWGESLKDSEFYDLLAFLLAQRGS